MCGIAGWLGRPAKDPDIVGRVGVALHHRGPDDAGHQSLADATLVHARLKVLDLSPAGHQPMANGDGSVWTVFNGEIYNHRELRRELEATGHVFRSRCDTEVIPVLYERHGPSFVERLRGMFALAVYDERRRKVVLARDRFGIKPLYYSLEPDRLSFASELNAIREIDGLDLAPDPQAIYDYLALLCIPAPATVYRGVRSLEPGQVLEADLEGDRLVSSLRFYHRWAVTPDLSLSLEDAADRASGLLDGAVADQLESDAPLGALLSGGIDSSLVCSAAHRRGGPSLRSFNVRFPDPDYDETSAAVAVAAHVGTRHETLDFETGGGGWDDITRLLLATGQPYADTSIFAVHAICRLMRDRVTVVLSGDGGDEAFGGYGFLARLSPFATAQHFPARVQRTAWGAAALAATAAAGLKLVPTNIPGRLRDTVDATDPVSALQCLLSWTRPAELQRLWRGGDVAPIRRLYEPQWNQYVAPAAGRLEQLSAMATEVAIRLRLANDFLPKVDIASMQTSLEVRVPLLDEDLFAFGMTLPHRLKDYRGEGKRVLRSVARRRLPPEVVGLPKHGFAVPIDTWVDASFKQRLGHELLGGTSTLGEFLSEDEIRPVVTAFCDGRRDPRFTREGLYQRVFMLLSLHLHLAR